MTRDAHEIERAGMLSDMETLRAEKRELRAEVERLRYIVRERAKRMGYEGADIDMVIGVWDKEARAALEKKP